MSLPTPHITAKKGDIAKTVIMPGDPLRAKFIAENFLENATCFNTVRNMFGYTGSYKGKEISVMGSGMGMPSIGIYSFELYNFYDVDTIIRAGSTGALQDNMDVMDIVIAQGACTDSNYAFQYELPGSFCAIADFDLLQKAYSLATQKNTNVHVGNVLSSDIFYNQHSSANDKWKSMGVLSIEMEAAALYMNAIKAKKKALGIFTVSDHIYKGTSLSASERQTSFNEMIEIALEVN